MSVSGQRISHSLFKNIYAATATFRQEDTLINDGVCFSYMTIFFTPTVIVCVCTVCVCECVSEGYQFGCSCLLR